MRMSIRPHVLATLAVLALLTGCRGGMPGHGERAGVAEPRPPQSSAAVARAMGFEAVDAWVTAPVADLGGLAVESFSCKSGQVDSRVRPRTVAELAGGARLVTDHVTQGRVALRWDRHPQWPTLLCSQLPADWRQTAAVALDLHSETATGEIVFVAFLADSAETPYRDWWYLPIAINWRGAKTLTLPLAEFRKLGSPAGWGDIKAMAFFAKMLGAQPHPQTALTLDNLRMLNVMPPDTAWRALVAKLRDDTDADGFLYRTVDTEWQRDQFNHNGEEIAGNQAVFAPYAHQNYFAGERAEFDYYPRFIPGYVSFDPAGQACIFSRDWIQWKGAGGQWERADLRPVLTDWARARNWEGLSLKWHLNEGEKTIRFDARGDAYVLITVMPLDKTGKAPAGGTLRTLLLHSRDRLQSWTVYDLGPVTATFEKLDGHNRECLERPPVMILGDTKGRQDADQGACLLLPRKNTDGTLLLPDPIRFSDFAISVPVHSGDGNMAITRGGKIFVVYAWYIPPGLGDKARGHAPPPIAPDHPGLRQTFTRYPGDAVHSSTTGTPIYIVEYDLASGRLSEPVYILSGGYRADNHNWPAITVDSQGFLHVLANGHQDPLNYAHSIRPLDISAWSAPRYITDGKADHTLLSYATLNCDRSDTLYSVNRNSSGQYNNRLSLFVKPAGKDWQPAETLVAPFHYGYKNWGHKMAYNAAADQLCLSFYSQSNLKQLYADTYAFDLLIWPDREKAYYSGRNTADGLNLNTGSPQNQAGRDFAYCMTGAAELTSLIMTCADGRWKLATSTDFR